MRFVPIGDVSLLIKREKEKGVCYEHFRRVTSPHLFDRVACMFRSIERGRMVESLSASSGTSGKLTLALCCRLFLGADLRIGLRTCLAS